MLLTLCNRKTFYVKAIGNDFVHVCGRLGTVNTGSKVMLLTQCSRHVFQKTSPFLSFE